MLSSQMMTSVRLATSQRFRGYVPLLAADQQSSPPEVDPTISFSPAGHATQLCDVHSGDQLRSYWENLWMIGVEGQV